MGLFIHTFVSKCDQIRRRLWIWSHLLKKSLMENVIFRAVNSSCVIWIWIGYIITEQHGNSMLRINNRNTKTSCETCSKLTIKTPEWSQWRRWGAFIVNFELIPQLVLVFLCYKLWAGKCRLEPHADFTELFGQSNQSNYVSL